MLVAPAALDSFQLFRDLKLSGFRVWWFRRWCCRSLGLAFSGLRLSFSLVGFRVGVLVPLE